LSRTCRFSTGHNDSETATGEVLVVVASTLAAMRLLTNGRD
jgi:hypothetical protein